MKPANTFPRIVTAFVFVTLLSVSAAQSSGACTPPEPERLKVGINSGVQYLLNSLRPDGKFIYRRFLVRSNRPQERFYNLLRHAGSIYALGLYYDLSGDTRLREPMQRAAEFLQDCCIKPVPGHDNLLAVWSDQKMTGIYNHPLVAKLGGAGLALTALMATEKAQHGSVDMNAARRLGKFVLYMQEPSGEFYSRYIPALTPSRQGHDLLYYPGEAALGLLTLYEQNPDPAWLSAAVRALTFLADSRVDSTDIPKDNWAIIASAMLLSKWPDKVSDEDTRKIYRHTAQVARELLSDPPHEQSPVTAGALESKGRTVPTAMRLEGVLAALQVLPEEYAPLKIRLKQAANCGIDFLLRSQIIEGTNGGVGGGALNGGMPIFPRIEDNFQRGPSAAYIRIDYVQHAIDAMIQYASRYHRVNVQSKDETALY